MPIGAMAGALAGSVAGGLLNQGMGMLFGGYNDQRQLDQQRRLQRMQIRGAKELGAYNQQLAMKTWNETNYEAQMNHLTNAGLNAGLMYGQAGAGGTTSGGAPGNVTGATAAQAEQANPGMGLQLGLQMQQQAAMQQAQIANINADTELKKTEAQKKSGIETESIASGIENMKQLTQNAAITESILQFEKEMKEIDTRVATMTEEQRTNAIAQALAKLTGEADSALARGEVDTAVKNELIEQAKNVTQQQGLTMTKTTQETENLKTEKLKTESQTVFQDLANKMRENGIEASDPVALRQISKTLTDAGTSRTEIQQSLQKIVDKLKNATVEEQPAILQWFIKNRPETWFK